MSIFNRPKPVSQKYAVCEKSENCVVKAGLAYTPAMVRELTEQGIAVSGANADAMFFDGSEKPSFTVPVERQRGCDAIDAWEASREARSRLIKAHLKDKEIYGDLR